MRHKSHCQSKGGGGEINRGRQKDRGIQRLGKAVVGDKVWHGSDEGVKISEVLFLTVGREKRERMGIKAEQSVD